MTVIIGMDPHKRSATIEIIDHTGKIRAVGRYNTDKAGYAEMLTAGRKFGNRVWAVEGCNGIGRHIAHRLVHDGETVLDVPAKLSAQIRVFATGNGRKTDPVDALGFGEENARLGGFGGPRSPVACISRLPKACAGRRVRDSRGRSTRRSRWTPNWVGPQTPPIC
ncbi:IS110 family transposase [Nocardia niigatensis]